jgi:NADH-quinone oxidoreductase subunit K
MVTLGDYLIVSGILFAIGFAGVMVRRNLIIILMSLELMLNAANISLVAFSRFQVQQSGLPDYNAQVFVFFIITVAAAEVAVGLAILVALYRARQTTDVNDRSTLKFYTREWRESTRIKNDRNYLQEGELRDYRRLF